MPGLGIPTCLFQRHRLLPLGVLLVGVAVTVPHMSVPSLRPLREQSAERRGRSSGRLEAFDAARGFAMLMVWLSHFMAVYVGNSITGWSGVVGTATLIASPTFMLLSGIMLGMLTTTGDQRARDLRRKLADRALFLLLVGHAILVVATVRFPLSHSGRWLGPAFITDTIGVSILVALWIVPKLRAGTRALIGIAGFALSWVIIVAWHPTIAFDVGFKEVVFGSLSYRYFAYSWAIVPWLSVYVLATGIGEFLAALYRRGAKLTAERCVVSVSMIAMTAGFALCLAGRHYHAGLGFDGRGWYLEHLLTPEQKWPPSPAYILFFGGAGLGTLWLMLLTERLGVGRAVAGQLARIGRCSLTLFLAQAFVYYKCLPALHLPYTAAWPLVFAVTVIPLYVTTRIWDAHELSRLLTVGLPHVLEWRRPIGRPQLMVGLAQSVRRETPVEAA